MSTQIILAPDAPAVIGTYSQAVRAGSTVYLAGQLPLNPATMQLEEGVDAQIHRAFQNVEAVARAAGGSLANVVKVTIYLTDLSQFPRVNEIMESYFQRPYPARVAVGVASLPRGALIEADAIMSFDSGEL